MNPDVNEGPTVVSIDPYLDLLKKCLTASIYDESAWTVAKDRRQSWPILIHPVKLVRYLVASLLEKFNYIMVKKKPYVVNVREQGLDWPLFGYTMIGIRRLDNIQQCVDQILVDNVRGDFVETGVWRGGSCIFMRALLKRRDVVDRTVWCCDSFAGMPVPGSKDRALAPESDYSGVDYLAVSVEQVQANFRRFGLLDDNVRFLRGWFRDTLPNAPIDEIALLRLDGDHYDSTMDALVNLYSKVSPGGYVIIDDYQDWIGCRTAVDEYRRQNGIDNEIKKIDMNAVFWRVSR